MDNLTWILVADASKARIFSAIKPQLFNEKTRDHALKLMDEYTHPDSRKRDQELVTDKQGSYGLGSYSQETDPKQHEEDTFALKLARLLHQAHQEKKFRDLIMIAPPAFMGKLNKHIHQDLTKIAQTIEKDYTSHNIRQIALYLQDYL